MQNHFAIIVAGGSGTRMGADIPKQFLLLAGRPVLMHTLERFAACECILVLPDSQIEYWRGLCKAYRFTQPHTIVCGGATRSESVMNGLSRVPDDALVAIHDGVRPLVASTVIAESFKVAAEYGSAVPVIDCVDSLRHGTTDKNEAVNRAEYLLVQTPQTFQAHLIKQAYQQAANAIQTDDATVLERAGTPIHLIKGNKGNIKITLPIDLKIAEALL